MLLPKLLFLCWLMRRASILDSPRSSPIPLHSSQPPNRYQSSLTSSLMPSPTRTRTSLKMRTQTWTMSHWKTLRMLPTMTRKRKKPGKGASSERRPSENRGGEGKKLGEGILAPESFVFEGHRASSKAGKPLMKFGSAGKKKGPAAAGAKPSNRSAKRGAAFKSQGKKKA